MHRNSHSGLISFRASQCPMVTDAVYLNGRKINIKPRQVFCQDVLLRLGKKPVKFIFIIFKTLDWVVLLAKSGQLVLKLLDCVTRKIGGLGQ
ncbi:hypothetical protein [Endozoicomonas sp. 4G]|uniref:hypothetical protein n=1 Tax=Endozoicomonas sp. 4G TaxID=2872754 RepID=UPI002078CF49|nr:hypothetical protein [Endozoicomonas sp. 4G]